MAEYTIDKIIVANDFEVIEKNCKEATSVEEANEWWEKHFTELEIGTYQLTKWNEQKENRYGEKELDTNKEAGSTNRPLDFSAWNE